MAAPLRVLFVCTANICRSAYAEVLARHALGDDGSVEFASAGVHGLVDQPIDDDIAAELTARGADGAAFRSRRLTMAMVDEADLVLTAEARHRQFILDDRPAAFRRVFTLGQFERAVAELPAELRGRDLVAAAGRQLRPARAADDVPDPYRRGGEAIAGAARHLERLVRSVADRLGEGEDAPGTRPRHPETPTGAVRHDPAG